MAFTPYTGKSVGTALTFDGVAIPGWRRVVIDESAPPLVESLDKTTAASAAYEYMDDPMGGKGTAKTTITVEGLSSQHDVADVASKGPFTHAMNDAHAFVFLAAGGGGKDKFDITPYLKTRSRPADITTLVPYTMTLELDAAGAWTSG